MIMINVIVYSLGWTSDVHSDLVFIVFFDRFWVLIPVKLSASFFTVLLHYIRDVL